MASNKENNKGVEYVQTRSMKLDKNSKSFPIILTIDGSVAEGLQKSNNPVVLALTFSAFAVQVASKIRNPKKGAKELTIPEMQLVASSARPQIGKKVDPIKRKDKAIRDLKSSLPSMTEEEKADLKKMLG